ncbi:MAG: glycosyltransferase family 9 protein [bacterium]
MNKSLKILIFRFGAIGDVVLSTSLFRSIKNIYPDSEIHFLTFKTPAILLKEDPQIKKLWIAEDRSYKYLISLAKELKKENFDIVFNLHPSIRTKIFTLFIKAKRTLLYKKTFKKHAVQNFVDTAKPLLKKIKPESTIKIYLSETAINEANKHINKEKLNVCLNIGATFSRQGRRWSIDKWKQLSLELIKEYDCDIILSGSEEDIPFADEVCSVSERIKSFCGKLPLEISAAVISLCNLMVSGDTGPLHIATATDTKSIALFGSMSPKRTGPYGTKHFSLTSKIKCAPCNKRKCKFIKKTELNTPCMESITVEEVLNTIKANNLLIKT